MRRLWVVGLLGFVLAVIGLGFGSAGADDGVAWRKNWDVALRDARRAKRPLLVLLSKEQCPYCSKLKEETLANPSVAAQVNDQYVPVILDGPQNPKLIQRTGVRIYPTILLVSTECKLLSKIDGFVDSATLAQRLKRPSTSSTDPTVAPASPVHASKGTAGARDTARSERHDDGDSEKSNTIEFKDIEVHESVAQSDRSKPDDADSTR